MFFYREMLQFYTINIMGKYQYVNVKTGARRTNGIQQKNLVICSYTADDRQRPAEQPCQK